MTRAGNAQRGVYMTDGIFNVALLELRRRAGRRHGGPEEPARPHPFRHVGRQPRRDAPRRSPTAGGSYVTGRKETGPNVYYEVKYKTPEGIVFDVTESGWKGAVKEVKPA